MTKSTKKSNLKQEKVKNYAFAVQQEWVTFITILLDNYKIDQQEQEDMDVTWIKELVKFLKDNRKNFIVSKFKSEIFNLRFLLNQQRFDGKKILI